MTTVAWLQPEALKVSDSNVIGTVPVDMSLYLRLTFMKAAMPP